jgi:hypothetical protein
MSILNAIMDKLLRAETQKNNVQGAGGRVNRYQTLHAARGTLHVVKKPARTTSRLADELRRRW